MRCGTRRFRSRVERRVIFSSDGDPRRRLDPSGRGLKPLLAALVGRAVGNLFATVFPSDCRLCGAPLINVSRVPVCDTCLEAIRGLDEPACPVCGQPFLQAQLADSCCPECVQVPPPFVQAAAYGSYAGGLRDLIHLLKYERVRPAAAVLGRMVAETAASFVPQFGTELPVVVPVPLHASKLRQRGFNQSELIAAFAVKALPTAALTVNTSALVRRRATESQTGLSRAQRKLNIRGAFEVVHPNEIAGRDILLVDDVFTTGTTVSECARVLRRAGAARVWVTTVARVLKPEMAFAMPGDTVARAAHA